MSTVAYISPIAIAGAVGLAVGVVCLAVAMWKRHQTRKIMKALNNMLDSAIGGSFVEKNFDESMLSSVECRLWQYLSASAVSAHNLASEKDKINELIADISHQTKTPISNILLYSQLLAEQGLSGDSGNCVRSLGAQAEKLSFLITSLVKLSRLETGVLTLAPRQCEVQQLLDEVGAQLASRAQGKGVCLALEPTDATALFDIKWTAEAVCNIVDNAIKYTPSGGSVRVAVTCYDIFCRVDVADTGVGIAEQEQARIFARFYRSPTVSDGEGVGIGLYLSRQIISGQGGYIKVSSSTGKGSTFSVFLPQR